jgi:hypothetical protein
MAKQTLSRTMRRFNAICAQLNKENIGVWGFMFTDHGEDETHLDIFSNHPNPLPVFIKKTEEALTVIRSLPVEGKPVEELEQEFAEAHAKALARSHHKIVAPN